MSWQVRFNSIRDEDLIANVLTIIERDFKSALDVLYPGLRLVDFRERALGQIKRVEFPCLAIGPRSNASSPSEDNGYLRQGFSLAIYVGVTDDTAENVTNKIMRYMTTMGEVLRAATIGDMFAEARGQVFGYVLESSWDYDDIRSDQSTLFRAAVMEVNVTVNSR